MGVMFVNIPIFVRSASKPKKKKKSETPTFSKFGISKPDIYFQRMKSDLACEMTKPHESFESTSSKYYVHTYIVLYTYELKNGFISIGLVTSLRFCIHKALTGK